MARGWVRLLASVVVIAAGCAGGHPGPRAASSSAATQARGTQLDALCRTHRPSAAPDTKVIGAAGEVGTASVVADELRRAGSDPSPWDRLAPTTLVYSCHYGYLPGANPAASPDDIPTTTSICPNGHSFSAAVPDPGHEWLVDVAGDASPDERGRALPVEAPDDLLPCGPIPRDAGGGPSGCLGGPHTSVCAQLSQGEVEITASGLRPGSDLVVTPDGWTDTVTRSVAPGGYLDQPLYLGTAPGGLPTPTSFAISGTASDGSTIDGRITLAR